MTDSNTKLKTDDSVFDAEGIKVYYSGFLALVDVHIKIPRQKIVAVYWPFRLWQKYLIALLQSHE